jgi:hypothetical protein
MASGLYLWAVVGDFKGCAWQTGYIGFLPMVLAIVSYVGNVFEYFQSDAFQTTRQVVAYQQYDEWRVRMVAKNPQYEITATWTGSVAHCSTTNLVVIPIESSNDSSAFLVLTQDASDTLYHVTTTITVDFAPGTNSEISHYRELIDSCRPIERPTQTTITEATVIAGFVGDQFVSASGNLPAALRRGPGVVAGIFFAGVLSISWAATIPFVTASIIKRNVTVGQFPLSCGAINYRCD